jgi:hypothetical protein
MTPVNGRNGGAAGHAPDHDRLRGLLADYAMARRLGRADEAGWREVTAHLAACADCRAEVDDLDQLVAASATGALPAATAYPRPDFWFLDPPPADDAAPVASSLAAVVDAARRLVIQFSEALVAAFRQPDLAGAFRGELYGSYRHPAGAPDDLQVAIDIALIQPGGDACRVTLTVIDPRDPFGQEGYTVRLDDGATQRAATTDHRGTVAFEPIPLDALARLRFTIERPAAD